MEHGNVKGSLQTLLDFEASGGADILQVDAAEGGGKPGDCLDDLLRILCIQTDGDRIDAAEFLEEDCLSLHDGHGGVRADIPKTQDGASVGNHGHGIGFHGISIGGFLIPGDYFAGLSHPGRVGDCQILPGLHGSFGYDFQLAVPLFVHHKRLLIVCHWSTSFLFG